MTNVDIVWYAIITGRVTSAYPGQIDTRTELSCAETTPRPPSLIVISLRRDQTYLIAQHRLDTSAAETRLYASSKGPWRDLENLTVWKLLSTSAP